MWNACWNTSPVFTDFSMAGAPFAQIVALVARVHVCNAVRVAVCNTVRVHARIAVRNVYERHCTSSFVFNFTCHTAGARDNVFTDFSMAETVRRRHGAVTFYRS